MDHRFYDLNVGFSKNWEEIINRAKTLELAGICLVVSSKANLKDYLTKIEEVKRNSNLEIVTGILIEEGVDRITKLAKKHRKSFELVLVRGGEYEINRAACSSRYVDILSEPGKGRGDCGIDHICCKEAKENKIAIELNFRELLVAQGMEKIRELNKMKEIIRLCRKVGTHFIVNSGAQEKYELRGGRELSSLSYCLGASLEEAIEANSGYPEQLIKRNREKMSQPLEGVSLEDYER